MKQIIKANEPEEKAAAQWLEKIKQLRKEISSLSERISKLEEARGIKPDGQNIVSD